MRWVVAYLSSIGLALSLANAALAQSTLISEPESASSFLSVTREDGAESCPEAEALAARVQELRGHQTTRELSTYHVRFTHRAGVFRADIRLGNTSGARTLWDRGPSCAALEQATAVTLALLLDSDARELPPEGPPHRTSPELAAPTRDVPEPKAAEPSRASFALALGTAGIVGVLQPIAPAALAELGIGVKRFRTSVGVLWVPTQTFAFGPGQLHQTLIGGAARTCIAAVQGAGAHLDLCSGIDAGLLEARADGYTRNDHADKPWLAVPLELSLSTSAAPLGVEIGASALLPLRRNDFAIDNLGIAYASWPIGLSLSLRAVAGWLL